MSLNVALSGDNMTTLRSVSHQGKMYLAYGKHVSVATAQVNQTSFSVPLAQLTVDNTSVNWLTAVKEGQTCWIGTTAGARDIGVYLVRKAPGATTLYLMEIPSGDPGMLSLRTTRPLADNAHITIMSAPNLWSVFPRIAYAGGTDATFYKKFDLPYTNQNQTGGAVPGVVRIGEHVAIYVGDGNTYIDTRTAVEALFNGSVSSRQWTKDAAGTVVSGSLTGASVGIEYPPGNYLISYAVTTSGGAVIECDRYIWVYDDSTNPVTEVIIQSQTINEQGGSFTAEIVGALPDDIMAGAFVMLWEKTASTTIDSATTKCVGFIDKIDARIEDGVGIASFNTISPLSLLDKLRGFSMILEATSGTPIHWGQVSAALASLDFFIFYVLYWHTSLLRLFDLTLPGRNKTKFIWKADTGTWLQAVNKAAELDDCMLTQDSHGNLYVMRDPAMMTTTEKNNVVNRMTLTTSDIVADSLSYERVLRPVVAKVMGYALSTDTSYDTVVATASIAAGGSGGQGTREDKIDRLGSQTDINVLSGNKLAKENNPFPRINWEMFSNYLVIEPALRYYIQLDITTSQYLATNESLNFKVIPTEVSIRYSSDPTLGGYRTSVNVSAIADTDGNLTPGMTEPITVRDGLEDDIFIPDIGLDGLPDYPFDLFEVPLDFALPPLFDIVPETSTALEGDPGTGVALNNAAVAWSSGNDRVWFNEDFTVPETWTEVLPTFDCHQCISEKNNPYAIFAQRSNEIRHTPDVRTTAFTTIGSPGLTVHLLRRLQDGNFLIFGEDATDRQVRHLNASTFALGTLYNIGTKGFADEIHADVDDFQNGLALAACNRVLRYTNDFGATWGTVTGLTGVPGTAGNELTCVRIPYKKVSGALNNTPAATECIISVYRQFIRRVTLNFNTGAVVSETTITPAAGTGTSGVFDNPDSSSGFGGWAGNLEVWGGNANYIVADVRDSGGTTYRVYTTDGGSSWSNEAGSRHHYNFYTPLQGGDGGKILAAADTARMATDGATFNSIDPNGDMTWTNPQQPRGILKL